MEVKEATDAAAKYLRSFFPSANRVKLEEVEITDDDKYWNITLSYEEQELEAGVAYIGFPNIKKFYKIFKIDTKKGNVRSMKIRDIR